MTDRHIDFSHGPVPGNAPEGGSGWFFLVFMWVVVAVLVLSGSPIAACVVGVPLALATVFFVVSGIFRAVASVFREDPYVAAGMVALVAVLIVRWV